MYNTLNSLRDEGYSVTVPDSVDALREQILHGNAELNGTQVNVHARMSVDDHVRKQQWLSEIEAQWGAAPGREQTNGRELFILGAQFGNVFVGVQPAFGYEGDPMRLLFEKGFAPTHAFAAFYRYINEEFGAHAALHFGTHGALEFMPGKQTGLAGDCWPDRLIGTIPNFYLYAANNPSEGTIAKRRSAATLISYLTPPVTDAGLYRVIGWLEGILDRWRSLDLETTDAERDQLSALIQMQAAEIDLDDHDGDWPSAEREARIQQILLAIQEIEKTLIPEGLHVVGEPGTERARTDLLISTAGSRGSGTGSCRRRESHPWRDRRAGSDSLQPTGQ